MYHVGFSSLTSFCSGLSISSLHSVAPAAEGSSFLDIDFGAEQLIEHLIIENVHKLANACGSFEPALTYRLPDLGKRCAEAILVNDLMDAVIQEGAPFRDAQPDFHHSHRSAN